MSDECFALRHVCVQFSNFHNRSALYSATNEQNGWLVSFFANNDHIPIVNLLKV